MFKKYTLNYVILALLWAGTAFAQQGGMWIPSLLKGRNEAEMKKLGLKLSADDIYSINHSSLKDAVPQFDGGCTAEVISPEGLILTNHHCGFDAIQNHSSVEHDYLRDGFWAYSKQQELPNKGMVVTFVVRIEEVTKTILEGVNDADDEGAKSQKIQANITKLTKDFVRESWQEVMVRSMFDGNQYILFVTETFRDIRLVGAPPSSIGKFGSDTDNWVWPRHTGDFSLFRIYADADNHPAEFANTNVPYKPKHFFPISIKGIKEGDFTMVMGYPGRTQEYLPAVAVEQILNTINPARIEVRDAALKIQDRYMRKDQAIKIQYASKYAGVANYWKKWIGESKGLKKAHAVDEKKKMEAQLVQLAEKAGKKEQIVQLFNDFATNYKSIESLALARELFNEIAVRNTELLSVGIKLYMMDQLFVTKGEAAFNDRKTKMLAGLGDFYKDFNPLVDQDVAQALLEIYHNNYPKAFKVAELQNSNPSLNLSKLYQESALADWTKLQALLQGSAQEVRTKLAADPGFVLASQLAVSHYKNVASAYDLLNTKIAGLQRTYMKEIIALSPAEARLFPDANSTLRITYGKVKGYSPSDAVHYEPITTLDGVLEKYIPGDYEFDVPQKLLQLHANKDYGRYGDHGKMPLAFIATNHTTGGNSGSPALDAKGNLIGLNFDRVWEGTMSDIFYSPEICRNIMVDARYVLFIIDQFAGAKNIISELTIVK